MIGAFVVTLATSLAGVSGFVSERLSQILELAQGSHVVSLLQGVSNSIGGGYASYALMLVFILLAIALLIELIESQTEQLARMNGGEPGGRSAQGISKQGCYLGTQSPKEGQHEPLRVHRTL